MENEMSANEDLDRKQTEPEDDTEGHSLLLDTDYYLQRKAGRDAEMEREARERRQAKEARTNKPERR
jgi:hypothetical protein